MFDYMRIACAVPQVSVGDVEKNTADVCAYLEKAEQAQCDLVLFPELCLTGYTCGDLFFQESLLSAARAGLETVLKKSAELPGLTVLVGLPLLIGGQMYNMAAVLAAGRLLGLSPKTYLPNYGEFYERRWFTPGTALAGKTVSLRDLGLEGEGTVPVGPGLLYRLGDGVTLGVEICEDLWAPLPPSTALCLAGAEVIANLSASNETIAKRAYRRDLVRHQSGACLCAYAYCSAGRTESTQDLIFSGHSLIAENGAVLAEEQEELATDYLLIQDVDLGKLRYDRRHNKCFQDSAALTGAAGRVVEGERPPCRSDGSRYALEKQPFVPAAGREERCMTIFKMQAAGLRKRLETVGADAVVGVSGGLDSTLALLVAAEATRQMGRPMTRVHGITMPCFGTTDRTYRNALTLMEKLGIQIAEIPIGPAVERHFQDIGQDPARHDATYENSQARERTQVLMDYAGKVGGIVVGTGDLSELALGWCTYNGDHMSMYGVNASIPKTLVRWMIDTISKMPAFSTARDVLQDILDTPISPELLPPDAAGNIAQQTEDLVGPYALHDFFLYYMLRYGFSPRKIYALACRAFDGAYTPETVKKWLHEFYRRFFTQQFKRSCLPDGVKVGSVCLSPRGDWRMPSDASGRVWLKEIEEL